MNDQSETSVALDARPDALELVGELGVARAQLLAARTRYADAEARVREALGQPDAPGDLRVATFRGRTVARMTTYTERRVNLNALRDSWPEVAETVTEEHLRTRLSVEPVELEEFA